MFCRNKYLINTRQKVLWFTFDAIRHLVLSREHSSPFTKRKTDSINCHGLCHYWTDNIIQSASTFTVFAADFWFPLKLKNTFHSSRKMIRHNDAINCHLFSIFIDLRSLHNANQQVFRKFWLNILKNLFQSKNCFLTLKKAIQYVWAGQHSWKCKVL